ncbi:MAG: alpha-aminoadipate/glutamate carrier protein LysW/ArgW [Desulfurococcales archaeon]|jgi:alpha-aminoadipate carrier protein LysW|nr:alpha-aminoadipate/glutamate carrier protein LysW/ArgW [Desulfurococcales archaeon]
MELRCPICGLPVIIPEDAVSGELVDHECGVSLEIVINDGKVVLKPFENAGEDWGE